jgi:hypothetical protein
MAARLARLVRLARLHGKSRAACRLIRRAADHRCCRRWLGVTATECFRVAVSDLARDRPIPRGYVVRRASEDDLAALGPFFGDPQRVRRRLDRGDVCVVTLVKGKVCAGVWLAVGPGIFEEHWSVLLSVAQFPNGVCWSFDGKGTRLGAWGSLMARLPRHLEELGVSEVYTLIDYDNRESLDAHRSLGYRRVGLIGCLRFFGLWLRIYKTPGARWRRLPGRIGEVRFGGRDVAPCGVCG